MAFTGINTKLHCHEAEKPVCAMSRHLSVDFQGNMSFNVSCQSQTKTNTSPPAELQKAHTQSAHPNWSTDPTTVSSDSWD